jgi:Arc-like DNA binding domain
MAQDDSLTCVVQGLYKTSVLQKWNSTKMTGKRGKSGRKSKGEFSQLTSSLTIRIPEDMRDELESEAAARGRSVSQELLRRLNDSFNRDRDKERDPALRGLLYMIGQLAEHLGGEYYMPDRNPKVYDWLQKRWRTDLFYFRAFKFAVVSLLGELEEPPDHPIARKLRRETIKQLTKTAGPELKEILKDESPENIGLKTCLDILIKAETTIPFTNRWPSDFLRKNPRFGKMMEREFYGLQQARRDLELKPHNESEYRQMSRKFLADRFGGGRTKTKKAAKVK